MITKRLIFSCCLTGILALPALAQDYHDISGSYLDNTGFNSDYNYTVGETGNVAQEILEVKGWTKNISVNYTITGVYQFATAKTFNGVAVPASGYDGTAEGGCLALSTGWGQSLLFEQAVTLPAGKYGIVSAIYNCGDKTAGTSKVGWIPSSGAASLSKVVEFPCGKWIADTVWFELADVTAGKIQIGYLSKSGAGSAESAKIVVDFVKLIRDTPIGKADVDVIKLRLTPLITEATTLYGDGTGVNAAVLKSAIDEAQAVLDNDNAGAAEVETAIDNLSAAIDRYLWDNPTGDIPAVTTDSRYARGATMAFGRMTAKGTDIIESGFCWAENPEPTINDKRTTDYLVNNGNIYWLKNLNPGTLYYMRAYAITKGRQVGYGEPVKFYTIPKGQIGYSIRDGGTAEVKTRITNATKEAVNYWNNLTSITGFSTNVGYNAGVPTAECSYGGYMSVGSNTSYQRTGTILHELLHGIGVIPWANTEWSRHNLRSGVNGDGYGTGLWLGDRVTELLRFWENNTTAQLNGDYQHMWPYGINGAQEDNGTELLYIGNGLVCQALGEDGLQHSSTSFSRPYYSFDIEEGKKYYLKNESVDRGLYSSYLVCGSNGNVSWKTMTAAEATANDSVAWTISFTPNNQYYQFRNEATGRYLTYATSGTNGIKTAKHETPTSADNFQLMRGRNTIAMGATKLDQRGYWIIHPESNWTPKCLQANLAGLTSAATFNIANSADIQRWLILSAEEMTGVETAAVSGMKTEIGKALKTLESLVAVPHTEDVAGTDQAVQNTIDKVNNIIETSNDLAEILNLESEVQQAVTTFLYGATPTDADQPFDLTYMLANPGMDAADGWSDSPAINYSCAEYYEKSFDFYQTLANMPAGTYRFTCQGFQRPGNSATAWSNYQAGLNKVTSFIYAGNTLEKMLDICTGARSNQLGGAESAVGTPTKYIPNNMQAASLYFARGIYTNSVVHQATSAGASLKVGLRASSMPTSFWTIFDDFHLYFYGSMSKETLGVKEMTVAPQSPKATRIYTLDGLLVGKDANALQSLPEGVYIINGKKVIR